jgi:hypothetical protein
LLAAVYWFGYDVRRFVSLYFETYFFRFASCVFGDSYQIVKERIRVEERILYIVFLRQDF